MDTPMDLTRDPLPRLMYQIAVPAATGMFLQTILNLTGTWFAGHIDTLAQAALALSFPVFFVLFTFGSGLSVGGAALVGRALGAGDRQHAARLGGQAFILALVLGLGLTLFGPYILKPAFKSMGATEGPYLQMCMDYMGTIFLFSPIFLVNYILNAFLTAQGDSRSMRNALSVAVVLNVPLCWWFMGGGLGLEPLGVTGLALATVLVQAGTLLYLAYRVSRTCLFRDGFWSYLKFNFKIQREVWGQVLPPALNQASVGVGIFIINWFVGHFGPEPMAAYGVAIRIEQLFLLPAFGLSMATLPLVAQNDGAGHFQRALDTRALALRLGAIISVVGTLSLFFGGYALISLLSPDEAVRTAGALILKFEAVTFFAYLILYINISFLQGLKRPMFAVWVGLYRQIIAPVTVLWLLAFTFDLGLWGIWMGVCLVTISGAIITEFYVRRTISTHHDNPQSNGQGRSSV